MTPRRKRLYVVLAIVGGVAASVSLAVMASRKDIMFYYDPTMVATGKLPPENRDFRVGGMVVKGSVARQPGDLKVRFVLTDFAHEVPVEYTGVLPDLFREGQGIIARGKMGPNGEFVAEEVLAKHDEKYMPPEVAASLKQKGAVTKPQG